MRKDLQAKRRMEIETIAYALIGEKGFLGISMLMIAKKAKASNETLYRWYGDKLGLFKAMVATNANDVKQKLCDDLNNAMPALQSIETLGPVLLKLLVSDRAIALNSAAVSDASGELGRALSEAGRESVLPLIAQLFSKVQSDGQFVQFELPDLCSLYIDLLIGDLQMRRAIGVVKQPTEVEIEKRATRSFERLMKFA